MVWVGMCHLSVGMLQLRSYSIFPAPVLGSKSLSQTPRDPVANFFNVFLLFIVFEVVFHCFEFTLWVEL